MDPYLESQPRWEIFHQWFIHELARLSLPTAVSMGCWIDVERDVYKRDPSGEMVLIGETDDVITFSSSQPNTAANGGGTATLAPPSSVREVVIDPGEAGRHRQYYLVVRENQAWPRALAVVELLSPANKNGKYTRTYNQKRSKLLASLTHFMEIDSCAQGIIRCGRSFPTWRQHPISFSSHARPRSAATKRAFRSGCKMSCQPWDCPCGAIVSICPWTSRQPFAPPTTCQPEAVPSAIRTSRSPSHR
jgi:hypothetical protein